MTILTIKDIVSFFNQSAKRIEHLKKNPDVSLYKLCETRCVGKLKSITKFKNAMVGLQKTFKILVNSSDVKTSSKSVELLTKIEGTQFIMALFCLESFLKQIEPFTVAIQAVKITIINAHLLMKNLIKVMESNNLDTFTTVFDERKELARKVGVPILMNCNEIGPSKKEFWFNTILMPAQRSLIKLLQAKLNEKEAFMQFNLKISPKSCRVNR